MPKTNLHTSVVTAFFFSLLARSSSGFSHISRPLVLPQQSRVVGALLQQQQRRSAALRLRGGCSASSASASPLDDRSATSPQKDPLSPGPTASAVSSTRVWPNGDALDRKIGKLTVPAILNLLVLPLVGIVDTIWVGRMNDALAIAGMQAGNQVFSSAFWVVSFLPTVVAPLIAAAAASGDMDALEDELAQAVWLGLLFGVAGSAFLLCRPQAALSLVVPAGGAATKHALPYIRYRALSFVPNLLATIGFATYRGKLDVFTPLKISIASQMLNVVLDPILIFRAGLGVAGASMATGVSELTAGLAYVTLLTKQGVLRASKLLRVPSWDRLRPLLQGGFAVWLRALALNVAFLSVTKCTQGLDATGTAAAAHAITINLWQLGGVFLFGLSGVASVLVPAELSSPADNQPSVPPAQGVQESVITTSEMEDNEATAAAAAAAAGGGTTSLVQVTANDDEEGARDSGRYRRLIATRGLANRLLAWGLLAGVVLGGAQIAALPLLGAFTPLEDVRAAAQIPSIIGAVLQSINGMVFVGEGIMQGTGSFLRLATGQAFSTAGILIALRILARPVSQGGLGYGLNGVWASFFVFNFIRLINVAQFHFGDGPLSPSKLRAARGKKKTPAVE